MLLTVRATSSIIQLTMSCPSMMQRHHLRFLSCLLLRHAKADGIRGVTPLTLTSRIVDLLCLAGITLIRKSVCMRKLFR